MMSVSRQISNERAHAARAQNKQASRERVSCIALVLSAQVYGESDLIVDLFTQRRGRTRVIARGALRSKRRYMGALEPGTLLKVDYPMRSGLPTLGACDIVSSHRTIRQDLNTLRQLYYILELLLVTTPEDEADETLFESAVELLATLESAAGLPRPLLYAWELKLLAHLGYELRISRCPHTGEAPDGLSYREGGAISSRAGRPHWPVATETLRKLYLLQRDQLIYRGDEIEISESEDAQLRVAFANLWGEITGRVLKSVRVLRQLRTASPVGLSLTAWMLLITSMTLISTHTLGCHGINESIPSQGTFSVDRSQGDQSDAHAPSSSKQTPRAHHPSRVTLKRPEGLPADLTALAQRLANAKDRAVTVGLRAQVNERDAAQRTAPNTKSGGESREIYCSLQGSWISAAIFSALIRDEITLLSAQSGLWVEHDLPSSLKSAQSKGQLTALLKRIYDVSETSEASDHTRVYDPTRDRGGQWIIYFAQDAVSGELRAQSMILVKSAPWIYDRAWVIGECEVTDTLRELTYAPLNIQRKLTSPLQLKLISAELQTPTVDD